MSRRSAFTLVEMLVVITIIALLAGMGVYAGFGALNTARETRIKVEISNLDMALKQFKNKHGAYPPSDLTWTSPAEKSARLGQLKQFMAKAFPQHNETDTTLNAILGTSTTDQLNPARCLVFFLRGVSPNPELPFSGTGIRQPYFEFDKSRLVGLDETQTATWGRPIYIPASGEGAPYVYFRGGFANYNTATNAYTHGADTVRPYPTRLNSAQEPTEYANNDSFQIISAGLDGEFGKMGVYPTGGSYKHPSLPSASNTMPGYIDSTVGGGDNIANFSDGTLGSKIP